MVAWHMRDWSALALIARRFSPTSGRLYAPTRPLSLDEGEGRGGGATCSHNNRIEHQGASPSRGDWTRCAYSSPTSQTWALGS